MANFSRKYRVTSNLIDNFINKNTNNQLKQITYKKKNDESILKKMIENTTSEKNIEHKFDNKFLELI